MSLDTTKEVLYNLHTARGTFYAFLSRVFSNVPDEEFYRMLEEISVKLAVFMDSNENTEFLKGVEGLNRFLDTRNSLPAKEQASFDLETARHYTTLFCLPTSVPTDESIYTSPEHRERQEAYDEMIALFRKHGFSKSSKISENEDFISYELLFMSKLAYGCVDLLQEDKTTSYKSCLHEQYNFHVHHLDRWISQFFMRIQNYGIPGERLYKFLALLGNSFITEDKMMLQELLEQTGAEVS